MTTNYRPQTLAVLKALSVAGTSTVKELEALFPGINDLRSVIVNLQTHRLVESDVAPKATMYSVTGKGWRLLRTMEPKPMGRMPEARSYVSTGLYTGERPIAMRPGSQDFLSCPSRRGEQLVPHALPISLAGDGE